MIIFRLLIKQYDGKMLTLDTMLSITQAGGHKHTGSLRNARTKSDQHFIDINVIPRNINQFRRKRLDGMPKKLLGEGPWGEGWRGLSFGSEGKSDKIIPNSNFAA